MPFAQTKLPDESSLLINMSVPPAEVKLYTLAPGSKSAVPLKDPVIYITTRINYDRITNIIRNTTHLFYKPKNSNFIRC